MIRARPTSSQVMNDVRQDLDFLIYNSKLKTHKSRKNIIEKDKERDVTLHRIICCGVSQNQTWMNDDEIESGNVYISWRDVDGARGKGGTGLSP